MRLARSRSLSHVWPRILVAALPIGAGCSFGPCNIDETTAFQRPLGDLGAGIDDAGCAALCSDQYSHLGVLSCSTYVFGTDGGPTLAVNCTLDAHLCGGGRRPAGFGGMAYRAKDEVAAWLARAAALEAASVPAFQILAAELRAHGAPQELVNASLRSAAEESRHARVMSMLALRHRAVIAPVTIVAHPPRSLIEIATENAIEGGVRERFGAWVAVLQAQAATDPAVRSAFTQIAPEELRHAELADAVNEWAHGLLTPAQRRRVAEARELAHAQLATAGEHEPSERLRTLLGLPSATRTQELVADMTLAWT